MLNNYFRLVHKFDKLSIAFVQTDRVKGLSLKQIHSRPSDTVINSI